jgi:energy-coupling factor transporter ATP-binding protein EcfA2
MFEEDKICPYTGLRPFTEDESIYFKGRDEHIDQATKQLEKNKFIMLTGASGDGKSSLVYAGIVPNAKAGFLKATFSNWAIADFRPERKPLGNLSEAVASQLGISANTVRTELGYGFSALVDIYKASSLYYDARGTEWLESDEKSRNEKKRKAANLIILADQFEEFFTNPENFQKGIPSQEAMSVTNLLLETARIALEENLPIYVIITMRSDFIGQCAAFRGLPEYIGFSQFFVPRLNRNELREVIEEPALLSGNKISRRLTERLIHDIVEGTDQLPILQHSLNQIWKMADEGTAEMDLLHYAMVGGMSGDELPGEDVVKFRQWFVSLPKKVQDCYDRPSLQNVLNTHANKLYNQAADFLNEDNKEVITDDDAKLIISTSFKCLTKIDDSRAVRNRMTLGEITAIINEHHLDCVKVGRVLDIFREPGNTLLRPFLQDAPVLAESDVLDITHESLIRNWENLEQWAKEEFDSYTISLDFERQLKRWTDSNKSDDFLLYIGPLTYFEGWINRVKPNAAWVARYLKDDLDEHQKLEKATKIQRNAAEFLKRSARKHTVTRAVIKYGPRRIVAVLSIIALLTLSSFVFRNYLQRQNSHVLNKLKETTLTLAANSDIILRNRAMLICEELRLGEITLPQVIKSISDPIERINVTTGIASLLIYQGTNEPKREIFRSLTLADSLIDAYPLSDKNMANISRVLKGINELRETLELGFFYNPSTAIDSLRKKNAARSAAWVLRIFRTMPETFTAVSDLNIALENALNYGVLTNSEIEEIIRIISPFEGVTRSGWVVNNYRRDQLATRGFSDRSYNFNGLFQELAYLYAASGNVSRVLQCMDTLLRYNENYFEGDYGTMPDNAAHVASCFYRYGKTEQLNAFVSGYCQRKKISEREFYARLLARCKLYEFSTGTLNFPTFDWNYNLSLEYNDDKQLEFFFTRYREVINRTVSDLNERKFQLALSFKDEGIIRIRKLEVSGMDSLRTKHIALFDKALMFYESIDPGFLEDEIEVVELRYSDNLTVARKFLFLYPDIRTPFHPNEPSLWHYFYVSGCFLEYILDNNLFVEFYKTEEELKFIQLFLRDYHFIETDIVYTASKRISYDLLSKLEVNLAKANAGQYTNLDFLYFYLGHLAAQNNESDRSLHYYNQLTAEKTKALFLNSFNPDFAFQFVALAIADLTKFNHPAEADRIVKFFNGKVNRSSLYAYAASDLLLRGINDSRTDQLIDSAREQASRTRNLSTVQVNRIHLAYALAMRNKGSDINEAYKTIKNVQLKFVGMSWISRSYAQHGELFEALQNVPENISDPDVLLFSWDMLVGYGNSTQQVNTPQWNEYVKNRLRNFYRPIVYVDENN